VRARAALLLAGALAACAPAPLPERANVLLITVDTLRADHLSCYGYEGHETPHIDRLAAQGALFERAFSDTPWTTPSMASVLTGLYPTRHGLKSNNAHRLGPEQVTLAEVLKQRGYATAAVIGSFPLDSIFRLDQGFDVYDDAFTTPIWILPDHEPHHVPSEYRDTPEERALFTLEKALSDSRRTDAEVTDAALDWLEGREPGPFFLWVHYFGPHSKPDWRLPESDRDRQHLDRYDPDVRIVDAEVGRLLAAIDADGLADKTLVVFHADHGESLGEQGYLGHGQLLNEPSVHIPLLLRLPGVIPAGERITEVARNVDLFPTVLDVTGGDADLPLSGRSLLPLTRRSLLKRLDGGEEPPVYLETWYPAHAAFAKKARLPGGEEVAVGFARQSVRRGRWRLERRVPAPLLDVTPEQQPELPERLRESVRDEALYDLSAPGGENTDVSYAHPDVVRELGALLDAYLAEERAPAPAEVVDEETRLRLESLGYGD
jgi:arylsulfatase A-like enzyme